MNEASNASNEQSRVITQDDRHDLLEAFEGQPNDEQVWNTAFEWVRAEGDTPTDGIAGDIPAEELIALAKQVRETSQSDRYDLMAERASNGNRWFDVLTTFSSEQLITVKGEVISFLVSERGAPFRRALDLGVGTGKSLRSLEPHAKEVVGIDHNPALLTIAEEVAGPTTVLKVGEVGNLPFEDASFDLLASAGLRGALDRGAATAFYHELARVMDDGGIYIEGTYFPDEEGSLGPEMERIIQASKGMLADMIVDSVSGKLQLADHLDYQEQQELLAELGMEEINIITASENGAKNLITVIRKA